MEEKTFSVIKIIDGMEYKAVAHFTEKSNRKITETLDKLIKDDVSKSIRNADF